MMGKILLCLYFCALLARSIHGVSVSLLPDGVVDPATGQGFAQLSCGPFSFGRQPSRWASWKTPDGLILNSTFYSGGSFILSLSKGSPEGTFICFHDDYSSATTCGIDTIASITLGKREVDAAVAEAERDFYKSKASSQDQDLEDCKKKVQELNDYIATTCRAWKDCSDVLKDNGTQDGVYTIKLGDQDKAVQVYCDQTTDGGGWTVIQRRVDGSENFFRMWADYEVGFGDIEKEFWLGLENIHLLSSQRVYKLRVDLEAFDGSTAYAEYDVFLVSDSTDKYRLTLVGYSGTADTKGKDYDVGFRYNDKMQFSTQDQDNDATLTQQCATKHRSGWWHNSCTFVNPNGEYNNTDGPARREGISWYAWREDKTIKFVEMKLRPI